MKKLLQFKLSAIFLLMIILFFLQIAVATAAGPFAPSVILDPPCGPTDTDCFVTTGWQIDTANNYVYNTTDFIGINTSAPGSQLTIVDDGVASTGFATSETFTGTGLDSFSVVNTTYTGTATITWRFEVVANGTPDEVDVYRNGALVASNAPIPSGTQPLGDGTEYEFSATTGHTIGDQWTLTQVAPGRVLDVLGTNNEQLLSVGEDSIISEVEGGVLQFGDGFFGLEQENAKFELFSLGNLSAASQFFKLEAQPSNGLNVNVGFEAQEDGADLKAKIYYATPLTNINVIEVGPNDIRLDTNEFGEGFIFDDTFDFQVAGSSVFSIANDGQIFSNTLTGGATSLSVDASGNIIRTPSDQDLKMGIKPLTNNLQRILDLEPVTYTWKDPQRFGEQQEIGFIAQDIERVVPEVVRTGGEYKSVNYSVLTALNAGAIKELAQQINERALSLIDTIRDISVDRVRARKGEFEELCVEDVCVTRDQFLEIVTGHVATDEHDNDTKQEQAQNNDSEDNLNTEQDQNEPSNDDGEVIEDEQHDTQEPADSEGEPSSQQENTENESNESEDTSTEEDISEDEEKQEDPDSAPSDIEEEPEPQPEPEVTQEEEIE